MEIGQTLDDTNYVCLWFSSVQSTKSESDIISLPLSWPPILQDNLRELPVIIAEIQSTMACEWWYAKEMSNNIPIYIPDSENRPTSAPRGIDFIMIQLPSRRIWKTKQWNFFIPTSTTSCTHMKRRSDSQGTTVNMRRTNSSSHTNSSHCTSWHDSTTSELVSYKSY